MDNCAYVLWSHRPDGRHNVYNRNERCPAHSPDIDGQASPPEMKRPRLKLAIEHLADDRNAVRPVKSDGGQIEDGRNGNVRTQTNQIDEDTRYSEEPNCVDWRIGLLVDFVPYSRQG